MSFVNTSTAVYVYINGQDVSEYLIEGSLSDDSVYTNSIITTTGSITLGVTPNVLDFNRTIYPIGSKVEIWVKLDTGKVALHPKGTLYVINSTVSPENQTLNLDIGCSLAFISDKEESYVAAVEGLFALLSNVSYFVIEQYDLSTLSALLEVENAIIYQDPYGNIQKVPAFGDDGIGGNLAGPKLSSFDKYTAISIESISETAIENNISAVIITSSVEVPATKGPNDTGGSSPNPPPFITSTTSRTVQRPFFQANFNLPGKGTAYIGEEKSDKLKSESNPNCGTLKESRASASGMGSKFKAFGGAQIITAERPERVTNGGYKSYGGPGRQVDYEDSWEVSSGSTWASTAMSNSMNDYLNLVNRYLSEANALLSKANQHIDARNQEGSKRFVTATDGAGNIIYQTDRSKYIYHNCNAEAFLKAAKTNVDLANYWTAQGTWLGKDAETKYAVSNLTQTFYSYGSGGVVTKKIVRNYSQGASWEGARIVDLVEGESIVTSKPTGLVQGGTIPSGKIYDPTNSNGYKLKLASMSTTTYQYSSLFNIETEEFTDYANPGNSFVRKNYSSSNSSNPEGPDRIISQTVEGEGSLCAGGTDSKDLEVKVPVLASAVTGSSAWFGVGKPYEKTVSFPATFKPVLPVYNSTNQTCTPVDVSGRVATYESILRRYAINLIKKITGDNRGFRITEKLRAEVFEYYPFYPVSISVESIGRAFKARVSASNWVFDSQSAICSFDCLVVADIPQPVFVDPSLKAVYIKTDSTKVLTPTDLSISQTASTVQITSLPTSGSLTLSGVPVTAGQQIPVTSISNGSLSFVPSGGQTAAIDLTYKAIDASGNQLSSIINTYPAVTTGLVTTLSNKADGGDFTLNVSTNGFDLNAGDFSVAGIGAGPSVMNAGDFDAGGTITLPSPTLPAGVPAGNGSVNPETSYGVIVKNANNNTINSSTLATSTGETDSIFDVVVDFSVKNEVILELAYLFVPNAGWDYGNFAVQFGTGLSLGTIPDPNQYTLDFGTFEVPVEPVLQSSVV